MNLDQDVTHVNLNGAVPNLSTTSKRALWVVVGLLGVLGLGTLIGLFARHSQSAPSNVSPDAAVDTSTGTDPVTDNLRRRHEGGTNPPGTATAAPPPNPDSAPPAAPPAGNPAATIVTPVSELTPAQQEVANEYAEYRSAMQAPMGPIVPYQPPTATPAALQQASPGPPAGESDISAVLEELKSLKPGAKEDKKAEMVDPGDPLPFQRRPPAARYMLDAGTVIHATLDGAVYSELAGQIGALIDENVCDRQGEIMIPQGSRLLGDYSGRLVYGQSRLLQAWHLIKFPDGSTLTIGDQAGSHVDGSAGAKGKVDNRTWPLIRDALLVTAFSAAVALTQRQSSSLLQTPSVSSTVGQQVGATLGELGSQLFRRNMQLEPIVKLEPATLFTVRLKSAATFEAPYRPMEATQ